MDLDNKIFSRTSEIPDYALKLDSADICDYWKVNEQKKNNLSPNLLKLFDIDQPFYQPGTTNWNLQRGIVSSANVATIIGENRYDTEQNEFLRKTKQLPPVVQNEAMLNGIEKESHVAQLVSDKLNKVLFKLGCVRWSQNQHISVNPDRITEDGFNIEIKAPLHDIVHTDEDIDYVIERQIHYYHQMQLQMLVLDLEKTYFVRWGGPPNKNHDKNKTKNAKEILSIVEIPRDREWWPKYKFKIELFINKVLQF